MIQSLIGILKTLVAVDRYEHLNMSRSADLRHQVPVGAVASSGYAAVDLQSSLVVHVSEPVALQSFVGSSSAQQRLHVEREQIQRTERKQTGE